MTADDRVKELAEGLRWPLSDRQRTAENIAAFVRSELAAHEHSHHGTGEHTEAEMRAVLAQGKRDLPPAADPPAVEHKQHCASHFGQCGKLNCRPQACDCGASDPKAALVQDKEDVFPGAPIAFEKRKPASDPKAGETTCTACGGDGYYKGPRLGDEPCVKCGGSGRVKLAAPDREAPKPPERYPERVRLDYVHDIRIAGGTYLAELGDAGVPRGVAYVKESALTEALGVLGALVGALPMCCVAECSNPATEQEMYGSRNLFCADCSGHDGLKTSRFGDAESVYRAQALLARHGVKP